MNYVLTERQIAYLDQLTCGPSQWYSDDPAARGLTRRGLAKYKPCTFAFKFVITEKGRQYLKVLPETVIKSARLVAEKQDAALAARKEG